MCLSVVSAQVFNVRVMIVLETVVSHEATVVAVNVSISASTIGMVVQSLSGTTTCASSLHMLWCKTCSLWTELA